ncbi:hypothetical protein GS399_20350 [Pedobacter sp. HMF7647]|uniref:Uncharacterized protein n=1 Tax=Hufsiella arboris TaxID=2695275 RepID=A0A7K1YFD7_9SPHI|nr:hypothetical protein [Hufsiella arboris]MXV53323.1 hypothetical protein [Hufsiella arboris]
MPISINPDAWVLATINKKKDKNLRIADFLDSIAADAFALASVWEKVINTLLTNESVDPESDPLWRKLLHSRVLVEHSNIGHYERLEYFYGAVSSVLGPKHASSTDYVVYKIGSILMSRKLTVEKVKSELQKIKSARLLSTSEQTGLDLSLLDSVKVLHQEAAALDVFAKGFRAQI